MTIPYKGDVCLEKRVRELERDMADSKAKLEERKDTLKLTADSLHDKLATLNELRGDVMTRTEYVRAHMALEDKITSVNKLGIVILMGLIGSLIAALLAETPPCNVTTD